MFRKLVKSFIFECSWAFSNVTHTSLGLLQMNYLIIEETVEDDPCKFALMSRETSERVILQAANPEIQQAWIQDINQVLDTQRDFLNGT